MSAQLHATQWIDARPWAMVDFVSDLHLQAEDPTTAQAFFDYLRLTQAQAIFILGDLFEVWVGDDVLKLESAQFERLCVEHLAQKAKHCPIYFLPGNRDFLIGQGFFEASGVQSLADPCVLQTQDNRFLLTHGDELCVSDHEYQQFRALVRSPEWVSNFLSQPIEQRAQSARAMRTKSQEVQAQIKLKKEAFPDLDAESSLQWLSSHDCQCLIHGHTHHPGDHHLDSTHKRVVLSDWDANASPARIQVLRLSGGELQRLPLSTWQ